jgi:hypothetical protein
METVEAVGHQTLSLISSAPHWQISHGRLGPHPLFHGFKTRLRARGPRVAPANRSPSLGEKDHRMVLRIEIRLLRTVVVRTTVRIVLRRFRRTRRETIVIPPAETPAEAWAVESHSGSSQRRCRNVRARASGIERYYQ